MKTASSFTRCLAFTLLELMVVITIIGVLSAVVVVNTRGAAPSARRAAAMADLKRIYEVAEIIHVETGRYPETIAEMMKTRKAAAMADLKRIFEVAEIIHVETGRYPETIAEMMNTRKADGTQTSVSIPGNVRSPWNHEYVYDISSGEPVVTCLGRDNQPGGTGEDEDLVVPAPAPAEG